MRAILITITEVDHNGDFRNIYKLLSHETHPVDCFDVVRLDHGDGIFVDDNGLLNNPQRFFLIRDYHSPLAGKGLCLGSDAEGDSIAAKTAIGWFRSNIAFAEVCGQNDAGQKILLRTTTPWTQEYPNVGEKD